MGHQGVGSGYVRQDQVFPMPGEGPLGASYGLSGPVSGVLFCTGQIVEQGAFAYIGIPGYGDHRSFFRSLPLSLLLMGENVNMADGDDGSPDEVGFGVAPWAGPQTFPLRILYQTEVQKPSPDGAAGGNI